MDHSYIDEHNVPALYLAHELDSKERETFEEHFADCAECMDRLALAEIFRGRTNGHYRAPETAGTLQTAPGFWSRLDRYPRRRSLVLAGLVVLLIGGAPAAFFAGENMALRARLVEQYGRITEWQGIIKDASGAIVWRGQGSSAVPSTLAPGTYTVVISGRTADGRELRVSSSRLSVQP